MSFKYVEWSSNSDQIRKTITKDYNVTYAFRVGQVWLLEVFASRVVTMDEETEVLARMRQPEVHQLIGAHRDPGGIADNIHRSIRNLRNEFK